MPNISMIRVLSRSFHYAHIFRIRRKDGHTRTLMRDKDQRVASKFILITSRGGIFCVGDHFDTHCVKDRERLTENITQDDFRTEISREIKQNVENFIVPSSVI